MECFNFLSQNFTKNCVLLPQVKIRSSPHTDELISCQAKVWRKRGVTGHRILGGQLPPSSSWDRANWSAQIRVGNYPAYSPASYTPEKCLCKSPSMQNVTFYFLGRIWSFEISCILQFSVAFFPKLNTVCSSSVYISPFKQQDTYNNLSWKC